MSEGGVLVTGVAGHLGSHLAPLLVAGGYAVRGADVVAPPEVAGVETLQVDLGRPDDCDAILEGIGTVVHCASIHPWKHYSDAEYLDNNIKGTWNLYAAMARRGVERMVLTSSIAAVGYGGDAPWPVPEDVRFTLGDLYSFTKHAQEDIARLHADIGQVQTLALRPPAFMPKSDIETAFLLTGAFALVDDIAEAHLAAVEVLSGRRLPGRPLGMFEALWTTNSLPYTAEDQSLYISSGMAGLVSKYWPEEHLWLREHGYEGAWLPTVYDLGNAAEILGWSPQVGLPEWVARLRG